MPPPASLPRRAIGFAFGVSAATAVLYNSSSSGLPVPTRAPLAPRRESAAVMSSQVMSSSAAASPTPVAPPKGVNAVNLRDIGEVDPRLRKGVLFRCSQIYTPEVLKELKIKTVVDLRGRAERGKRRKPSSSSPSTTAATTQHEQGMGPPPLLNPDQVSALGASQRDQIQGQPRASLGGPAGGAQVAQQQGQQPVVEGGGPAVEPGLDFAVTKLRRQESSIDEDNGSVSEDENHNGSNHGGGVKTSGNREEVAAALGEQADWQLPETEAFNVIPGKQFGYAMLRMPLRVWRGAFGNLLSGKDPRKPFVDAFADEQLLGFYRYYKIILEHSKSNIAAVLRVFAKTSSFPSLVHCAHGKDRTGVIIMLLLLICDAPHEAIVQDYIKSELELRKYRESLGLIDPTGATGAVIPLNEVIIASTEETLRALLAYMDSTYITVDNYLSSCGLTTQEVAAIRRNLMKPEALTAEGMPVQAAAAAAAAGEPAGSA